VGASSQGGSSSAYAMSAPTFVPNRGEIWYSDGNSGFYALHVTNGVWPFPVAAPATARSTAVAGATASRAQPPPRASAPPAAAPSAQLAVTGGEMPVSAAGVVLAVGLLLLRMRRSVDRR